VQAGAFSDPARAECVADQINAAGGTLFRERQIQWAIRYQF
jgi:hypothetical protein